jgi:hypothetical protein
MGLLELLKILAICMSLQLSQNTFPHVQHPAP